MTIGRIEAGWHGLRPHISLTDVRIYDAEGREALHLPSVENILAWRSLLYGELRLHSLAIEGPRLTVRRDASGALEAAGIPLSGARGGEAGFAGWLLALGDVEIRNAEIEWRDELRGAPPLALSGVSLRLRAEGERHSLGLKARLPAALGGEPLDVRVELAGDPAGPWRARLYAELSHADLAAWGAWIDLPAGLRRGVGSLRLWTSFDNGALRAATVDVAAADVAATLGEELPALELASLRGRLQLRSLGDGYHLSGRGVSLAGPDGMAIGPADFQLAWREGGGMVNVNAIELAPLERLLQTLPVPQALRSLAAELAPRGQVADVSVQWEGEAAAPRRFRARARFAELGLAPWRAIPGFSGLAGTLEASEDGGRIYLHSRNAAIALPEVFPEPRLAFDTLSAQIDWQREPGRFSARFTSASFANADLAGSAFGAYTRSGDGPGAIDLSATLARADASRVARYLPLASIMGEKPRAWLVAGILGGQASDVHLRLRGNLADFPYADPARGQFQVTARVHDGVLHYADGWPRIEAIDATLHFERAGMEIVGHSGRILGARLANVRVSIPDLGAREPRLTVTGEASGPTQTFLDYIAASPVRGMTDGFTDGMRASGSGRLRLGLELPLAHLAASRVSGEYELAGNTLELHERLPPFEQAAGRLAFSEASFAAREVRARLLDGPVVVSGGTRGNGLLQFSARGALSAQALAMLPEPWRRRLSGEAPYAASLELRGGATRVVIDSSLRGLASSLPAPLAKPAGQALPLHLELQSAPGRERLRATLGTRLAAEALREANGGGPLALTRAALRFTPSAGERPRLPAQGIAVHGSLAELDLDAWRALDGVALGDALAAPLLLDVKLGRLTAWGRQLSDLTLRASGSARRWSATLSAAEVQGDIGYRADEGGRVVARLKRLALADGAAGGAQGAFAPGELPALDFVAEQLSVRGRALGRVELAGHPQGADWRIEKLAVANDDGSLRSSGWWRGAPGATALEFSLRSGNAGALLARLGYGGLVAGGTVDLDGALSWPGEPLDFDGARLSGELRMRAQDGQFLEIEPGIGKLISLMSLQALPRRIALDFRDVFAKGFRFDRVDAASHVDRGVMQLREFRMRGPAAEVEMSGEVDLGRETQDLHVRVVPGLGDSASTVIGLVNPVAGVTAALAQRALKNPLGQIFAHELSVTGGWSEPEVTRLNAVAAPMGNPTP